jgi:hypothetical protein
MSHDEMSALHRKLDAIHVALVGNPELGHKGLVSRVEVVEGRVDGHDKTMLKWGGVAVGVSLMVTTLKDKLFH